MSTQLDRAGLAVQVITVVLTGAFLKVNYDMLKNMRETLMFTVRAQHTLERGWLTFDAVPFEESRQPKVGPNVFELTVQNVGRSAVRDVVVNVNPSLGKAAPSIADWRSVAATSLSRLVVGPSSKTLMVARYHLSPDGAVEIARGAKTLYVNGYVAYNTICESGEGLSRERRHVTQVCYEYDPTARRWWKCDGGNAAL